MRAVQNARTPAFKATGPNDAAFTASELGDGFALAWRKQLSGQIPITMHALIALPLAAIGYSLVYLLFGGGLFGAFVIFIIAKIFGK